MPRYIKTDYPNDIVVGSNDVDRRFGHDTVVLKADPNLMGLTQAQALKLAAALLETIAELTDKRDKMQISEEGIAAKKYTFKDNYPDPL